MTSLLLLVAIGAAPGDEVELASAPVTALSCAQQAAKTGDLDRITACPLEETAKGLVVFDVAEKQIYRLSKKSVRQSELDRAFGGGSIDVTGTVKSVDTKDGVPLVEVTEYRVTPKPKAGSFKGCL